jgi:translation initiation factor 3 subunit I
MLSLVRGEMSIQSDLSHRRTTKISIRVNRPETGEMVQEPIHLHDKTMINRIQTNMDKTLFMTSSPEFTSKLYDCRVHDSFPNVQDRSSCQRCGYFRTQGSHRIVGGEAMSEAMGVATTVGNGGRKAQRVM